ncbi:MAG TPA: glycosyltransferase [Acidimicrobiales bacterium]|nr:glycosyltransferase [Acidimicrobiales bacterium]
MTAPPAIRAGVVSVVLVNYRGAEDTITCLQSFAGLDWPADRIEFLVVDNASGDGSAERIRAAVPGTRIIESEVNRGFAGGCNLGAAAAEGEFLAFINADARPAAKWVSAAVDVLDAQADVACVASKVLDWDGERIDYVDGSLTWYGMGYKREVEQPDAGEWDTPKDVLFATGAAMFVRASVYRAVEGFDDRYFMFYEDVDLGWRLNLLGWRVRYVPTSVAYHRHHQSMKSYGAWREHYLLERNALFSLYKNLGDDLLAKALPAALLLAVRRGLSRGDADNRTLDLETRPPAGGPEDEGLSVSRETLAPVFAIDGLTDQLQSLDDSRRRLQAERRRSDTELLPLFRQALEPAYAHPRYEAAHRILVEAFGIERAFSTRRKIVIATGETLSARMAGPAIRAWAMAGALSAEHDVVLVTTGTCTITHPRFTARSAGLAEMRELERWCDVFVFQGLILSTFRWLIDSDKILIADIYNPFHLEQLEQAKDQGAEGRARTVSDCTTALNDQLTRGDFFLCASDKQRDFWLGQLSAVGRINPRNYDADETMGSLIAVAPFGVPDEPPVHTRQALKGVVPGIGTDDKVILWGGGIYNWFDPITLLHAVDRLRQRRPDVRLFFLGLKHPNPDVPEMRMAVAARTLSDSLGLTDKHVFFNEGWVAYEDRQNYLLEADIGVSTHLDHVETAFSFRTRILDYLWTCLPIVATGGDTFADLIDSKGLGITVAPGDVEALEEALFHLLDDEAANAACRARLAEVMPGHTWSKVLTPMVEFCRAPRRAADLAVPAGSEDMARLATAVSRRPRLRDDVALAREYFRAGGPVEVARRATKRLLRYGVAVGNRLSQ